MHITKGEMDTFCERLDTNFRSRTQPERDALLVLHQILQYSVTEALRAGITTDWLNCYPFGGIGVGEKKRREVVNRLKDGDHEDVIMGSIIYQLDSHTEGRRQLWKALGDDTTDSNVDTPMLNGESTAGLADWDMLRSTGRRVREESMEERALRRRRREAVVVSDGVRPIGREDIIQREPSRDEEDE